jgi:sterol desaturase/sphingolipid hydroxylase (fatty acid hydroxylase superfamily)
VNRIEIATFGAIVLAGVAFTVLERWFPYNTGQRVLRTGFWNDIVLYCLVQSYVLGVLIGRLVTFIDGHTGWSRLGLVSGWPIAGQLGFFLVTHDLYIYTAHRLQHRWTFLWRFHEAHHSVPEVDWLSGVRSHAIEILINQTVEFAPILFLGAAPEVAVLKGAISAIWGMFIHSNLDVRLGPLQYVINGPEMHRWHHANDPVVYSKNFSTKLAIWDWIFGTAYFPDRERKKAGDFGLGFRVPDSFPAGYFQQQALAFRRDMGPVGDSESDHASTDAPGSTIGAR